MYAHRGAINDECCAFVLQIDTADELLVAELMLNGVFTNLDAHQMVALVSCLVQVDYSSEEITLKPHLAGPLQELQASGGNVLHIASSVQAVYRYMVVASCSGAAVMLLKHTVRHCCSVCCAAQADTVSQFSYDFCGTTHF